MNWNAFIHLHLSKQFISCLFFQKDDMLRFFRDASPDEDIELFSWQVPKSNVWTDPTPEQLRQSGMVFLKIDENKTSITLLALSADHELTRLRSTDLQDFHNCVLEVRHCWIHVCIARAYHILLRLSSTMTTRHWMSTSSVQALHKHMTNCGPDCPGSVHQKSYRR